MLWKFHQKPFLQKFLFLGYILVMFLKGGEKKNHNRNARKHLFVIVFKLSIFFFFFLMKTLLSFVEAWWKIKKKKCNFKFSSFCKLFFFKFINKVEMEKKKRENLFSFTHLSRNLEFFIFKFSVLLALDS